MVTSFLWSFRQSEQYQQQSDYGTGVEILHGVTLLEQDIWSFGHWDAQDSVRPLLDGGKDLNKRKTYPLSKLQHSDQGH